MELNLEQIVLIAIAAILGATWDLRSRRIPNKLTGATALAALALWVAQLGAGGFIPWIAGLAVGGGLLLAPYLVGGIGAGDVKLLAALGSAGGMAFAMQAVLITALVGGLIALAMISARWARGTRARRAWRASFPYAPAIAAGALATLARTS